MTALSAVQENAQLIRGMANDPDGNAQLGFTAVKLLGPEIDLPFFIDNDAAEVVLFEVFQFIGHFFKNYPC
jgi:hypothetical protein